MSSELLNQLGFWGERLLVLAGILYIYLSRVRSKNKDQMINLLNKKVDRLEIQISRLEKHLNE